MDERFLDVAAALELQQRENAIAKARGKPESDPAFDGQHCIACDDQIPVARLALGKIRCVACQETRERRRAT